MIAPYAGTDYETDEYNVTVTVPPLIRSLAIDLSCFYATLTYRRGKSLDEFDPVYLRYQLVKQVLLDIVNGRIEVDPPKPNEPPEHRGRAMNTVPSIFTPHDSGTTLGGDRVRPSSPYGGGYMSQDYY